MIILEILTGIIAIIVSFVAFKVHQIHIKISMNFNSKIAKETMLDDYKNFDISKGHSTGNEVPIETLTRIQTLGGDVHISSEKLGKSDVSDLTNKIKNLKGKS